MKNIRLEPFYQNLNNDFKKNVDDLIRTSNSIKFYEIFQISFTVIIFLLLVSKFNTGSLSDFFNSDNISLWLSVLGGGAFFALMEKMMEPLKNNRKKTIETIKNKMIISICNCNHYCKCKDNFINYMKNKGIKII